VSERARDAGRSAAPAGKAGISVPDKTVCLVCFASLGQLRPRHLGLLSAIERARRDRYLRDDDRDRFALGAALLRLLAGAISGQAAAAVEVERTCPRCGRPHGRPRLPGWSLHASVTHSGDVAGVAISAAGAVGIDLEAPAAGRVTALDARQVATLDAHEGAAFDAGEVTALWQAIRAPGEAPLAGAAELRAIWTRKEAVLKATGVGLQLSMSRVRVSAADREPALLSYDGREPPAASMLDLRPFPGYVGCVCVLSDGPVRFECVEAEALLSRCV